MGQLVCKGLHDNAGQEESCSAGMAKNWVISSRLKSKPSFLRSLRANAFVENNRNCQQRWLGPGDIVSAYCLASLGDCAMQMPRGDPAPLGSVVPRVTLSLCYLCAGI